MFQGSDGEKGEQGLRGLPGQDGRPVRLGSMYNEIKILNTKIISQ